MAAKPLVLVLSDSHVYWLERFAAFDRGRFCVRVFPRGFGWPDRLQRLSGRYGCYYGKEPGFGSFTGSRVTRRRALVQRVVQQVVVCQVVRRKSCCHLTQVAGTARVAEINECLRAVCDDEHLSFWRHKGFWNSQKEIFRRDGVLFNARGNIKLWKSVHCSCFGAMKRLQKL